MRHKNIFVVLLLALLCATNSYASSDGSYSKQILYKLDAGSQYPLSVDGDRIYADNIDVNNSDNGGFTGEVTDYFNSLKTVNNDASVTNPKVIKIWFNGTIQTNSIGFGCDDLTKSFSNIKIKVLGSGEEIRYTRDLSTDDTKRNSYLVGLVPLALNGIQIEFHTADEIGLSNLIIFTSENVNSRIQAVNEVTGELENISSFNGALNIADGYVHKIMVNEYFTRDVGPSTTLSVVATAGDTDITVADSTGLAIGDLIKIGTTIAQEVGVITTTNVVGNVITLDRPIAATLPIGTVVKEVENNMASAAGTLTNPVIYELAPPPGLIWQITTLLITITDDSVMDDGKFGGIAAFTNGVQGVVKTTAGRTANITNWKTNGDMMSDMFLVEDNPRAPAGVYGLRGKWDLTSAGIIAEVNGDEGEYIRVLMQDDGTGNISFRIKAQGRVRIL